MTDSDDSGAPGTDPAPDSGQHDNELRPPTVGPDSPRRLNVPPDSLLAPLAGMTSMSTMTQMLEYEAIANVFLAETIEQLNYTATGLDTPYEHAHFFDTVERFLRAEAAHENSPGPGTPAPHGSFHDKLGRLSQIRTAQTDGAHNEAAAQTDPAVKAKTGTGSSSNEKNGIPQAPLPNFPKFRLDQSFFGWVHGLAETDDLAEFATVLGSTITKTFSRITTAMMLIHGLPHFFHRAFNGEFTIEHVHAVARAARDLHFEHFPFLDAYLANRRADVTIETFRKSVNTKVGILQPVDQRLEEAAKRRRVEITTYPDGTAAVILTGPAEELQAYYLRLEAFARTVKSGQIGAFTHHDVTDLDIIDDLSINALMFDISTRTRPQLTLEVTTRDTTTGDVTNRTLPLDIPDNVATRPAGIITAINRAAGRARTEAAAGSTAETAETDPGAEVTTRIGLIMPTHGQWIRSQAKMITTVPFLTAIGASQLPGSFSDGSPIPADTARAIAGECETWTRILTDKATGTPLNATATTYRIPAKLRLPLVAKWQKCTTPGCIRQAETSEIDHIIPYDHDHPDQGGLTTFMNTHPVCKSHHQGKTDRKYSIRMTTDGSVEYMFRHGIVTEVAPPDQPINAEHATLFDRYALPPETEPKPSRPKAKPRRSPRRNNSTTDPWSSGPNLRWDRDDPPPF